MSKSGLKIGWNWIFVCDTRTRWSIGWIIGWTLELWGHMKGISGQFIRRHIRTLQGNWRLRYRLNQQRAANSNLKHLPSTSIQLKSKYFLSKWGPLSTDLWTDLFCSSLVAKTCICLNRYLFDLALTQKVSNLNQSKKKQKFESLYPKNYLFYLRQVKQNLSV